MQRIFNFFSPTTSKKISIKNVDKTISEESCSSLSTLSDPQFSENELATPIAKTRMFQHKWLGKEKLVYFLRKKYVREMFPAHLYIPISEYQH